MRKMRLNNIKDLPPASDLCIVTNGTPVEVQEGVSGRQLANLAGAGNGRRAVISADGKTIPVNPWQRYSADDLRDRSGKPVSIVNIPDRTKGIFSILGNASCDMPRTAYSQELVTDQVRHVAAQQQYGDVDFDEEKADWVVLPEFPLPRNWRRRKSPLLIVFPKDYPTTPPIGFYLPETLRSPNGHFYDAAYHGAANAPLMRGWKWYCCTVDNGSWRPYPARQKGEWLRGDNLWTYLTLINEVLASPITAD